MPHTVEMLVTIKTWYRYVIPLVAPYLLPVLVAVIVTLANRRKGREVSCATASAVWLGALGAIVALLVGNLIGSVAPTRTIAHTAFDNFLWKHYVITCFDFQSKILLEWQLPYIALSLILPALAAFLARRRAKGK